MFKQTSDFFREPKPTAAGNINPPKPLRRQPSRTKKRKEIGLYRDQLSNSLNTSRKKSRLAANEQVENETKVRIKDETSKRKLNVVLKVDLSRLPQWNSNPGPAPVPSKSSITTRKSNLKKEPVPSQVRKKVKGKTSRSQHSSRDSERVE